MVYGCQCAGKLPAPAFASLNSLNLWLLKDTATEIDFYRKILRLPVPGYVIIFNKEVIFTYGIT